MKKIFLATFALALVASFGATRASAQATASLQPEDKTAPSYDMKAQAMLDLDLQNKKIISLVEVLPQDKFTWRPSPDARSFAEVFLHVSGERYSILALGGAKPPASFDTKTYEKSTTVKAKILAELKASGDFTQATIGAMTNAEFAKLLPDLGPQANAGDVVYILVADCHEHMGQLVAYARENGIVPPWTIAAQKAAEEKAAKDKAAADKKPQ
jgi:uncharacterized damage-inducible protein DinB